MYFKKSEQELLAKRFGFEKYLGSFDFVRVETKELTEFPAHILVKGKGDNQRFLAYWTEYSNKEPIEFTEEFSPSNYSEDEWSQFNDRLAYECESCSSEIKSGFVRHVSWCKCQKIRVTNRGSDLEASGDYKTIKINLTEA